MLGYTALADLKATLFPMGTMRIRSLGKCIAALACLAGGVAFAQVVQLAMLDRIAPGKWEVRPRNGGAVEQICLDNGRRLIQLRHPNLSCRQFVVEDQAAADIRAGGAETHY